MYYHNTCERLFQLLHDTGAPVLLCVVLRQGNAAFVTRSVGHLSVRTQC